MSLHSVLSAEQRAAGRVCGRFPSLHALTSQLAVKFGKPQGRSGAGKGICLSVGVLTPLVSTCVTHVPLWAQGEGWQVWGTAPLFPVHLPRASSFVHVLGSLLPSEPSGGD